MKNAGSLNEFCETIYKAEKLLFFPASKLRHDHDLEFLETFQSEFNEISPSPESIAVCQENPFSIIWVWDPGSECKFKCIRIYLHIRSK